MLARASQKPHQHNRMEYVHDFPGTGVSESTIIESLVCLSIWQRPIVELPWQPERKFSRRYLVFGWFEPMKDMETRLDYLEDIFCAGNIELAKGCDIYRKSIIPAISVSPRRINWASQSPGASNEP